jgi:hypothetical protein
MAKRRFQRNALFRNGPDMGLNACVGDNGGPYDFADYGEGFFRGGTAIVETIKTNRIGIDVLIYPAAFAFRHGIELYLKELLMELISVNRSNIAYEKHHGIQEYWRLVMVEMGKVEDGVFDPVDVGVAGDTIGDFCQIDPTGQVFRYPEDIKGNRHLTELGLRASQADTGRIDGLTVRTP